MSRVKKIISTTIALALLSACAKTVSTSDNYDFKPAGNKQWLAGDHHIHGKFSAKWDTSTQPPTPILFGDAHYFTALNAQMAKQHGLQWMVTTDHGGPKHSRVNLEQAYPELVASRKAVPGILQFYGMEFDTPNARHSTLIIPHTDEEAQQLYTIESQFNRREAFPNEFERDTEAFMLKTLKAMQAMSPRPVLSVNHPARQADELGRFKKVTPEKMRLWQDTAPDVITGMTGIPGHQAATINPDGSIDPEGTRAEYYGYPTHGGTDQMTAIVGGVWDSFLGEGRRWSITAVSDSHAHYTEGRTDFWPGEYAKTYVHAQQGYDSVLNGLRGGKVFVTTGDLITELYVSVSQSEKTISIGETLVAADKPATVTIAFLDPDTPNYHDDNPSMERVDLIYGEVHGNKEFATNNVNPTTEVIKRFYPDDWTRQGNYQVMTFELPASESAGYIRVRGTNRAKELEPQPDVKGENPWTDLWFYSNPVYIDKAK